MQRRSVFLGIRASRSSLAGDGRGISWSTVSPCGSDDVVRLRVLASRWNECDRFGPFGHVFFTLLKLEQYRELLHYDPDGNWVSTSEEGVFGVLEGNGRDGLQFPRKEKSHGGHEEVMDLAFCGNVMLTF